jgi:nickel transport protein
VNACSRGKTETVIIAVFALTALWWSSALAHRVTLFAWVEGDTVYTESKFSGGRRPHDAAIEVHDDKGNQLLVGKTDDEGRFSFKVPRTATLKISLRAGMGHGSSWIIPQTEIEAALASGQADTGIPETRDTAAAPLPSARPAPGGKAVTPPQVIDRPSADELAAAFEKALDAKLAPLITRLHRLERVQEGFRFTDILGGIGYILGLMGVAAYIGYRKREK